MNKFSKRLTELMKEKNILQKELSKSLGFSQNAISRWCNNNREPDFDTLIKICDFFDVSTDYMLGVSDF